MLARHMLSMSGLSLYRNVVQFGMNVALAAFVPPAEYGLIVFTTPFLVLIAMLTDLGTTAAIVRAPSLSAQQAGAALAFTTIGGAGCAAALTLAATPLEHAIGMPGLGPVMSAMALVVVLSVAAATPRALLERQLRYERIAALEAIATALAAIAGLIAAWHGAGVWALVLYNALTQLMRAGGFWWMSRAGFALNLSLRQVMPLLTFGGWVVAGNLLNFLARNGDNLLIGAWLGAASVGVYGLSYQFMIAPLMAITWPTSGILLATLREHDPRGHTAKTMIEGVIAATAMIAVPAMLYLTFGLAWPAAALLSPRWQEVPEIVAWLAPAGALQSLASYNGALLLAVGRARAQFVLTVLNTVVLLVTFVLSLPFGLMALVHAYVAVVTVSSCAFLGLTVALTQLRWRDIGRALAPPLIGSSAGLVAVAAITGLVPHGWTAWTEASVLYGLCVLGTYALMQGEIRRTILALMTRGAAVSSA